jgi:PAS domain S-box-containing protein
MDMNTDALQYISSLTDTLIARGKETIVILGPNLDDPEGPTIHLVNAASERLLGRPSSTVIGQPLGKICDLDTLSQVLDQLRKTAASREPVDTELKVTSADGRLHWIEISTTPVFDPDGSLRHFVRIGRDITMRKMAEQQRELTQRLLASLFGVIDDPLLVTDDRGQVVMVNAALGRHLGWGILDAIGMESSDLLDLERQGDLLAELLLAEEHKRCEIDATLKHRDGRHYEGGVSITVVRVPNGRPYHLFKLSLRQERRRPAPPARAMEIVAGAGRGGTNAKSVVAGKLQLIGLDAVRQRLGERWPALAERTFAMAERVIQKHLRQGDVLRRSSEDGFLVLFSNLSEAEAQFKALAIGNEIREQFIGELPEAAEARVASFAATVTVEDEESKTEESIVDALSRRLEVERSRLEETARNSAQLALKESSVIFNRLLNERRQPAPITLVRAPQALREPIASLEALGQTPFTFEQEVFLLTGACERILNGLSQKNAGLIAVPVRIETLSQPREIEAWLAVARALGAAGRQRIIAEVTGIPSDIAHIRMRDITMRLSTLFRSIAYELPTTEPGFVQALPSATKLATIPWRRVVDADGVPHERTARLLKSLATRNCRLIVKDVAPDQVERMVACGATLIEVDAPAAPAH